MSPTSALSQALSPTSALSQALSHPNRHLGADAADTADAAVMACASGASTLCFSPPMSTSPPDLVKMYMAKAAKATKPTRIFHMLCDQSSEVLDGSAQWPMQHPGASPGCLDSSVFQAISVVGVDVNVLGFLDEQGTDHEGHEGDDDRVPQAAVDVALCRHDRERNGRQEAAEPAVANVIRQAH